MTFSNKKLSIGVLISVIILLFGGYYYFFIYNKVSTVTSYPKVVGYDNLESLESDAEIILIGTPTDKFEDRDHKATYYPNGKATSTIQDFYTLTSIKVQKVIKSNAEVSIVDNGDLKVIEPVGLVQQFDGLKKLEYEGYTEMEKGKKYLLFLKKNTEGQYSIMSLFYGKYNLDDSDMKDLTDIPNREKIKDEAKIKYMKVE
jgi:hypothetical protein